MSDYPETMDHMLAAWNEPEFQNVRSHLERAMTDNIRFVDPANDIVGLDAGNRRRTHQNILPELRRCRWNLWRSNRQSQNLIYPGAACCDRTGPTATGLDRNHSS